MNNRVSLGDRLVAVEPLPSESRQKLEQELHAMFVKKLSTSGLIFIAAVGIGSLGIAILCGYLAITAPARLPVVARVGLGLGTLFGLAWAALTARVCWRGTLDLKVDNRQMAGMVWVFTTLMMTVFLMAGMSISDRLLGLMMIAFGLTFLISAGVVFLSVCIQQADLNTREQFLRLELRLAELSEKK
jgi:hypothetical protein